MGTQLMFNPSFGRYLLLKRIAEGGMAEIFRAMSFGAEGFKKLVAIKRILPELSKDHQFVDMFINEAKIVANLNHPNIVQTFDFGNIDGQLYHCMEYVHGKNLSDIIVALLHGDKSQAIQPACYIILEVLNGLEQAHRQRDSLGKFLNIIHRDMTPSNVLVSFDGEVKIADFGIAKATQTTVETVGGIVKGKYRYLSPEQGKGQPLDQRTDIFSLGICFYEILTLTEMYPEASGLLALEQVTAARFKKPREANPAIPEKLEAILLKALAKEREERYQTATEWRNDLVAFMGENKIHLSRTWLAEFMQKTFGRALEVERAQLAQEDQLAEQLRPEPGDIAKMETDAAAGLKTMVVDLAKEGLISLSEAPYGEEEDSRESTAEMTIAEALSQARLQQGDPEEDADDVVTQEKKLSDIMAKVKVKIGEDPFAEAKKKSASPPGTDQEESTVLDSQIAMDMRSTVEQPSPKASPGFPGKTRAEPVVTRKPAVPEDPPLPTGQVVTLETLAHPEKAASGQKTRGEKPHAPARPARPPSGLLPGTPVPAPASPPPERVDPRPPEPLPQRSVLFYVVFVLLGLALGMGLFSLYLALGG